MLTPEEFPYIKSIRVNDCYAYQDFDINLLDYQPFSHLILTGKNGSGKTTILRNAWFNLSKYTIIGKNNFERNKKNNPNYFESGHFRRLIEEKQFEAFLGSDDTLSKTFEQKFQFKLLETGKSINIDFKHNSIHDLWQSENYIIHFFQTFRKVDVSNVKSPINEDEILQVIQDNPKDGLAKLLNQYLVNKQVEQAFKQIKGDSKQLERLKVFFKNLEDVFSRIFSDQDLKIEFDVDKYDFLIKTQGKALNFNVLSDGFSAFISIILELLIRVDFIQKRVGKFYDPSGIVLIDEPENHLHLSMQYEVLPLLTTLFPNIQFVVATHSPAVISSIKNATVFDLTTKETLSDEAAGSSFSELMLTHFGLENEFSPIADEIIKAVNESIVNFKHNKPLLKQKLQEIFDKNEHYLSPTLRIELESMIIQNS